MSREALASLPDLRAWLVAAPLAVALPPLLAFNLPPSSTFLNQAAALIGWSVWLLLLAGMLPRPTRPGPGLASLQGVFGLIALAALGSMIWAGLPGSLGLSALGLLAAAALTAWIAAALRSAGHGERAFEAFCGALVLAGALSSVVGLVQAFAPDLADGFWVAATGAGGRAVGNLRQPNHLSSLLLWAMIAVVPLLRTRRLPWALAVPLCGLMLFGVVLTGSRTGLLGTLLLAAWGALDRSLERRTRLLLVLTPVAGALLWLGMAEWARLHDTVFAGEAQLRQSDPSSSRFGIWKNTLTLIAMHPWLGVGFGEFNFAWTLTPFPGRPVAFFDHTHNLELQLAVELGLPLAALVLALLARALWEAWRAARAAPALRAALVLVLMAALHSQFEYPLWYAYFLLPAAFAFGLCLGAPASGAAAGRWPVGMAAALLLLLGSLASVADYWRVVVIFQPPAGAPSLAQRIEEGRRSWLFGHHGDYAAATVAEHPSQVMPAFERATHYLLDTRLMMAWANALAEAGQIDRARHLAQRLREFRNEQAAEYFAVCDNAPMADRRPYQCVPPAVQLDYRAFK
ncbi:PglL family O-oligosaccharyltransferase [Piscinibacter defluvii]|uniref:PglL family O-oligosaccharyltransferase n=1 Tax=Piscinibacter defluvii TaxID=1796922 RepID=UPI000FDED52D|nr:O-antigen ligase family protein [Piscinibacter defluvii]